MSEKLAQLKKKGSNAELSYAFLGDATRITLKEGYCVLVRANGTSSLSVDGVTQTPLGEAVAGAYYYWYHLENLNNALLSFVGRLFIVYV